MESFKQNYIYPIYAKFQELQEEYLEKSQNLKDDVESSFKITMFYLFVILFIYYFHDFFLYLLRKFDKLLIN